MGPSQAGFLSGTGVPRQCQWKGVMNSALNLSIPVPPRGGYPSVELRKDPKQLEKGAGRFQARRCLPYPRVSDSEGLVWGLRTSISSTFRVMLLLIPDYAVGTTVLEAGGRRILRKGHRTRPQTDQA